MTNAYYRSAVGALLLFDCTRQETFENISKWLKELKEYADKDIVVLLVGNKIDLKKLREVQREEASSFAEKNGLAYIETSALAATNVDLAFERVINGKSSELIVFRNSWAHGNETKIRH